MKTVIAGSRGIWDYQILLVALESWLLPITAVLSGRASGADRLGERYAREMALPMLPYPANWEKYGPSAGYLRNRQMARDCDAAIILWDGHSPGSKHMANLMDELDKPYLVHIADAYYRPYESALHQAYAEGKVKGL